MPPTVTYDGDPLDVIEMFRLPLDLLPSGAEIPAIEIVQSHHDPDLAVSPDEPFGLGCDVIKVPASEPAMEVHIQNPSMDKFIYVCGRFHTVLKEFAGGAKPALLSSGGVDLNAEARGRGGRGKMEAGRRMLGGANFKKDDDARTERL